MCEDCISRDGLKAAFRSVADGVGDSPWTIEAIEAMIERQGAVEVEPVRYGRWVYDPNGCDWGIGAWRCSECGCKNDALPWDNKLNPYSFACSHYCPHCGARMCDPPPKT